jgi:uncharacterized membrane protein
MAPEWYLAVKWIHIVSAMLLFGTGLGTAFHFWFTCRGGVPAAVAASARATVVADFAFTLPAAIVQPASGLPLARIAGYPLDSGWLLATYALYVLAGACWIPVLFIQVRLRDIAAARASRLQDLGDEFQRLYRAWFWLGWPAFLAMIAILWLMVSRGA